MPSLPDILRRHLDVRQEGDVEWLCVCPFHADTNPSFYVNVQQGLYYCQACGASGAKATLFQHLGITAGVSTSPEALRGRWEALRGTGSAPRAIHLPEGVLASYRTVPTPYWQSRGLSAETVDLLELGYDVDEHAGVIPLRDPSGKLVALIRRRLDPGAVPKYLYPRRFPVSGYLYGAHLITGTTVAITEGSLDAAALIDVGIPAVAILGSKISRAQTRQLADLGIRTAVLFLDNDDAGRAGAEQVAASLKGRIIVRRITYDGIAAKDPGECTPDERLLLWQLGVQQQPH